MNKISIELTNDVTIINKILDNPLIYQMANGTSEDKPQDISYREELTNLGFKFLKIEYNHEVIGLFCIRPISKICMEVHTNILPEFHAKGLGKRAQQEGEQWVRDHTSYKSMMTYVPSNCFHMLKYMQQNGWIAQGILKEAIIYNKELSNLYIFQRGIK